MKGSSDATCCSSSSPIFLVFGHTSFVPSGNSQTLFPFGIGVLGSLRVFRLQVHFGLSSCSFSLSVSTGALHPLFMAWYSRSLSRSLLRERADSSFIDKYLSTLPDCPLAVGRSAFGSCSCIFSLSSSGCSQLQLAVPPCVSARSSSFRSNRARSRSSRRTKGPLVFLRPSGTVGDGIVEWSPGIATINHAEARSTGFGVTSTFCKYRVSLKSLASVSFCCFRSVLGEVYSETPVVLPIRGHLDSIARMMIGDCFFDRSSRQRSLSQSLFCNDFKVAVFGREEAIRRFSLKLLSDNHLRDRLWTLSGLRSVCHCKLTSICHGDVLLREFKSMFPNAFDRDDPELSLLLFHCVELFVRLRGRTSLHARFVCRRRGPPKGSGWRGHGEPMSVGVGNISREVCDGQTRPQRADIQSHLCGVQSQPDSWNIRRSSVHRNCSRDSLLAESTRARLTLHRFVH